MNIITTINMLINKLNNNDKIIIKNIYNNYKKDNQSFFNSDLNLLNKYIIDLDKIELCYKDNKELYSYILQLEKESL